MSTPLPDLYKARASELCGADGERWEETLARDCATRRRLMKEFPARLVPTVDEVRAYVSGLSDEERLRLARDIQMEPRRMDSIHDRAPNVKTRERIEEWAHERGDVIERHPTHSLELKWIALRLDLHVLGADPQDLVNFGDIVHNHVHCEAELAERVRHVDAPWSFSKYASQKRRQRKA